MTTYSNLGFPSAPNIAASLSPSLDLDSNVTYSERPSLMTLSEMAPPITLQSLILFYFSFKVLRFMIVIVQMGITWEDWG